MFSWNNTTWVQKGNDIVGSSGIELGMTVRISNDGNLIAVSSQKHNSNRGKVELYYWNGLAWALKGSAITGSNAN